MKNQDDLRKALGKAQIIANAIADLRCPDHDKGVEGIEVDAGLRLRCGDPCCEKFREIIQQSLVEMAKDKTS
jgi:hypothetical protein